MRSPGSCGPSSLSSRGHPSRCHAGGRVTGVSLTNVHTHQHLVVDAPHAAAAQVPSLQKRWEKPTGFWPAYGHRGRGVLHENTNGHPHRVAVLREGYSQGHATWWLPAGPAGLTARFTRLGLIDREGPAFHRLALELGHRRSGRSAIGHLDKAKAFGAAGVAIRDHPDLVHHTIRLEELAEVAVGGAKRQIANKNIHGKFPMGKGTHDRQVIRTVCRSTMPEPYAGEGAREPRNHKTCLMVSSDSDKRIPQNSNDGKRITNICSRL